MYLTKDNIGKCFLITSILLFVYLIFSPLTGVITNIDEYFTITVLKFPIGDVIQLTASDVHPPLYYLMAGLFSQSLLNLKILSMIPFVILLLISVTKIRNDYGWLTSGLFAFSMIVFSEFFIHYLIARMYSWAILFIVISFIAYLDILKKPTRTSWIILTVFSVLGAYTHYFAAITSIVLYLLLFIKIYKTQLREFLFSVILGIVLYLPWLSILFTQLAKVHNGYWIPQPTFSTILTCFSFFIHATENVVFCSIMTLIFIGFLILAYKTKDEDVLSGFYVYIGVILLATIISLTFKPILRVRYLLPASGILWLSISILVSRIDSKKLLTLLIIFILALAGFSLVKIHQSNNDLYDEGVNQAEFFNNLSGDNDSIKIISSPLGLIYFIDDLNDSNVYVDNYSEFYGVNASHFHNIFEFKQMPKEDLDKLIEDSGDKDIYIIDAWKDYKLNDKLKKENIFSIKEVTVSRVS